MSRILSMLLITLASLSGSSVLGQCPSAFVYSTGAPPSLPINEQQTDLFPGQLALYAQKLNVENAINATGIAIYPSTSSQVGPYNITGGIYSNNSNTMTLLRRTGFVIGSNWASYSQTTSLKPLILSFDQPIALAAGGYHLAFWAVNMTTTTPLMVIMYATPSPNVDTLSLPVNAIFDYVPNTVVIGSENGVVTPGYLTSIVIQPNACSLTSSSSSSSSGMNGAESSHTSRHWLLVLCFVLAIM